MEAKQALEFSQDPDSPVALFVSFEGWTDKQLAQTVNQLHVAGFELDGISRTPLDNIITVTLDKKYMYADRQIMEVTGLMLGLDLQEVTGADLFVALGGDLTGQQSKVAGCPTSSKFVLTSELDGRNVRNVICSNCLDQAIAGDEELLNMFREDRRLRSILSYIRANAPVLASAEKAG